MSDSKLLLSLIILHCVGAGITIFVHHKNGTMYYAAEHGDGIRIAKPDDVIFLDCVAWEIQLVLNIITAIGNFINNSYKTKKG